jgi:hypothetical protein
MKVPKSKAFVFGLLAILGVYGTSLVAGLDATIEPVLAAIVALTSLYIGGSVADNGVKGKYFNPGLVEKGS